MPSLQNVVNGIEVMTNTHAMTMNDLFVCSVGLFYHLQIVTHRVVYTFQVLDHGI